jgi:tetratricopeptide (TPR) repeat protein
MCLLLSMVDRPQKPGEECENKGGAEVRYCSVILLLSAAAGSAASGPRSAEIATQWASDGRFHFFACEFRQATRSFENALAEQPDSADLHYWLGKSYTRLAEVSGLLFAPKDARRARRSLEQAVKIDPQNEEYLQELFDFYVDSLAWFSRGLERAAPLLERFSPGAYGAESRLEQLADSRKEHSGVWWWVRWAVLRTSGAIGYFVPQPYPHIGSRVKPGEFYPIISYLCTEWKCDLDCHYCWAYDNDVTGMTEDGARRFIDWLHDNCFSTLNHNLSYCYNASRAIRWVLKQGAEGFQRTTGGFED